MKSRYRLFRRGVRNGAFYCVDTKTGKRTSLRTGDEDEASQIIHAKNQALRQPVLNMQIAKAYLYGTDNGTLRRAFVVVFTFPLVIYVENVLTCDESDSDPRLQT